MKRIVISLLCMASSCWFPAGPEADIGKIDGLVTGSEPIRDAAVELRKWDPIEQRWDLVDEAVSDQNGRFEFILGQQSGSFWVTAAGGVTSEFWSDDEVEFDDDQILETVSVEHIPGEIRPVVVSPLSSLGVALAEQRLAEGAEAEFFDAVRRAYQLLREHFHADVAHTMPAAVMDASLTEDVRHALALAGLSSLAHQIAEESGLTIKAWNTITLGQALIEDARGPGALLDGIGPAGRIEVGACPSPCFLSANTLRANLVRALLREFLRTAANVTGLGFGDAQLFLDRVATNSEPELFDAEPIAPIDEQAPEIRPLESPIYREIFDRIDFDDALTPNHIHAEPPIDLASAFNNTSLVVYKHINLLHRVEDNPLRWRFEVLDDAVGADPRDVDYRVLIGGAHLTDWLDATLVGPTAEGMEFEVILLSDDIPSLATTEDTFSLELRARDRKGNVAPIIVGSWKHVPLAPPLWVGPAVEPTGPRSLQATRLEFDNLAPLLSGNAEAVLMTFDVYNGTRDGAYLTLTALQPSGNFSWTWLSSQAFLQKDETTLDDCVSDGTCTTDSPSGPTPSSIGPQPLPPLIGRLRVIEKAIGTETPCISCDPGEFYVEPGRLYEAQVLMTNASFLIPVQPSTVGELQVGPTGNAENLTGVSMGTYAWCERYQMGMCLERNDFELYEALTSASIQALGLAVSGLTSATPTMPSRAPAPSFDPDENTFATPVEGDFVWTTNESILPNPDPPP